MRLAVYTNGFANQEDEIHFFKHIKSKPLQYLVYYTEVRKCELRLPQLGKKPKLRFLREQRQRINRFFSKHLEVRHYLLEGGKDMDAIYFLLNGRRYFSLRLDYHYHQDTLFETSHDVLFSTIQGMERFGRYLMEKEQQIKKVLSISGHRHIGTPFNFTLPPTAAMELIYALREAKAINHGNFEIKAFTDFFCSTFDIEIKDPYALFGQISNRKKQRAKYLQQMPDALLNFLDERDA